MSLRIGCYIEESVAIGATKGLEDFNNVAHVTYMIIVSQQSDSILVFPHTPPSELINNISVYNIKIIENNVE